jgi:KipI family sensor histidine kinase inhibitor
VISRPYGDRAVHLEPDDPAQLAGLRATLGAAPGVLEVVPAARTLLVSFDQARTSGAAIVEAARQAEHAPQELPEAALVELPVRYDGADLQDVAEEVGCSVPELIARHSSAEYTVDFCGFAPGFAYLSGLEPALHRPRLATPRTQVPAGSVGIAGEYTGVYPRSSPGGWRLLGRTEAALWDPSRTPPALLAPGVRVRFRPL